MVAAKITAKKEEQARQRAMDARTLMMKEFVEMEADLERARLDVARLRLSGDGHFHGTVSRRLQPFHEHLCVATVIFLVYLLDCLDSYPPRNVILRCLL